MLDIKKEPNMNWKVVFGIGLIYLGLLLFLFAIHYLAINSVGLTQDLLEGVFRMSLPAYIGGLIFGLVALIIHFLRWITWMTTTPVWRMKSKGGRFK